MDLFQMIKKAHRESTPHRQTRFSHLFLVTFLMLFLVVGITFVSAINKAHATSTGSAAVQLSNVTMFDLQHGWALNETSKHVFTTHQGPEHWMDVTPSLLTIQSNIITTTFFQDATHAYVGVLQGANMLLLSTQDGGRTWKQAAFTIPGSNPGEASILQITFLDLQHGWLSFIRDQIEPGNFDFVLMSTIDGGKTWQTVLDTYNNPASLERPYSTSLHVTFVSPQEGWATGFLPASDVYLYATFDGGKTWRKANLAPVKGGDAIEATQSYGPYWQNSQQGILYVKYDNSINNLTTYRTLDGGKSWLLGPSTSSTSFQEMRLVSFLNAREGWSFGFDGAGNYVMHQTRDGGLTWKIFAPTGLIPADAENMVLINLDFINSTTAWLTLKDAQGNYLLFETTTGGHTWRALHPVD